jgi:hypothetical protein
VFDNFVAVNESVIVTFNLEMYWVRCTKNRIELVCNKHAFTVPDECNVNTIGTKRKGLVNGTINY